MPNAHCTAKHGPNGANEYWVTAPREEPTRPSGSSGLCGDCGGTGDCIHCNQGYYTRRDGTKAICGKCHGRTRRGRYQCHACKGKGYGGQRCGTPTYVETEARNAQARNSTSRRELCESCGGDKKCRHCQGTSWVDLKDGSQRRCLVCQNNRGVCTVCGGIGYQPPTLY